jgi:hypothetical protein
VAVVAAGAAAVLKGAWFFALTTALSAVWLWSWLFAPFDFAHWWSGVLPVLVLLGLLAPAAVLFLVAVTVRQLAYLPRTLVEKAKEGKDRLATATSSVRPSTEVARPQRAWTLGRALFDLWALVIDSKGMLLQYAGMVRLANPASLMVVGIAVVAGLILMAAAGATLVVSLAF